MSRVKFTKLVGEIFLNVLDKVVKISDIVNISILGFGRMSLILHILKLLLKILLFVVAADSSRRTTLLST